MIESHQRLHTCRGAPERDRVTVFTAVQWRGLIPPTPLSPLPLSSSLKKPPNHPQPIGTCCIGIQVSRGSHGIAPGVIGKREEGSNGGGSRFSFFSPLSSLFFSWHRSPCQREQSAPLWGDKRIIIKAHQVIRSKQIRDFIGAVCHKMPSDRFTEE